jgi:hypothetical protein
MIKSFVETYMSHKNEFEELFSENHPKNYAEIVKGVVGVLSKYHDSYEKPDHTNIHEIDDGDYQGTLLYVIPSTGYQPDTYWVTKVSYGSCSGCDTLESIREYGDSKPDESQIKDYMTLCLHLIQQMKEI